MDRNHLNNFQRGPYKDQLVKIQPVVLEEMSFEGIVDTDDAPRTTDIQRSQ